MQRNPRQGLRKCRERKLEKLGGFLETRVRPIEIFRPRHSRPTGTVGVMQVQLSRAHLITFVTIRGSVSMRRRDSRSTGVVRPGLMISFLSYGSEWIPPGGQWRQRPTISKQRLNVSRRQWRQRPAISKQRLNVSRRQWRQRPAISKQLSVARRKRWKRPAIGKQLSVSRRKRRQRPAIGADHAVIGN